MQSWNWRMFGLKSLIYYQNSCRVFSLNQLFHLYLIPLLAMHSTLHLCLNLLFNTTVSLFPIDSCHIAGAHAYRGIILPIIAAANASHTYT